MKEILEKMYKNSFESFCNVMISTLNKKQKMFIITANPETLMLSKRDIELNTMLHDNNSIIVPDGIGIVKAAKIKGINIQERITGVDIVQFLFEYANKEKLKVYLFGSKQEVIEKMEKVINKKYKNVDLVGATNGYIENKDEEFKKIKKSKPDIVMVALGIPAQEKLIYKHLNDFKKGIFIGVGGSFDVISGTKKRAPKLFIDLNLEWLYRIICEPTRIKRFWNNNIRFLFEIKKEK
mgnify:CR=1 FL=1